MSAVGNAFAIIEAVTAAGRNGLPFTGVVEQTGVPKASAHRLLQDLVDLSAIAFDPQTRRYRGGLHLARLGAAVLADYDLRTAVRPHLEALHVETGHVSTLGVRHDAAGIYVDKLEPQDFGIRLHSEVGKTFPLHCTAIGKVLLAHADTGLRRRLLSRKLEAYTEKTITEAARLREELSGIVEKGYAVDNEEITRGLVCVAAPIRGPDGDIAGAMSCTFQSHIADERGIEAEVDAVRRHAADASA